ncbi:MAG: riboflavin biosynthesis protein RibF [Chthonomonas sp.]|nr:riboflavin biosynthesis protein RibF [Chthonomonas sp.]
MLVHFGIENIHPEWKSSTVVVGTFDGVHLGHRALISRTTDEAKKREQPAVIVTFDRHPATILAPTKVPPQIGTLEQNVINMRQAGASVCVILPFDRALSQVSAQRFLDEILKGCLRANQIVMGDDFAFGHGREGTPQWLAERIETAVVPKILLNGKRVSSSLIRQSVAEGKVEQAAEFLGRPFSIAGVVVSGHKRGREIGYPTLNLARSTRGLVPAEGVYAGSCRTPIGTFRAAISVGRNETFGENPQTIEAFLLDYPGDEIYGAPVELSFELFVREQSKFENLDDLKSQMARDVELSRG